MSAPLRALVAWLGAFAALALPVAGCLVLLVPGTARAAAPTATITCPRADGTAGGVTVAGTNHTCETVTASTLVVGGNVTCSGACGPLTLTVVDPHGNQFTDGPTTSPVLSVRVTAAAPGSYAATLTEDGTDAVRTGFDVAAPPTASPSSGAAGDPGTAAPPPPGGTSTPPAAASGGAPSASAGAGAATGSRQLPAVRFPALPPPAGMASLAPLPAFPTTNADGSPVAGPYGKTLPYDGSVTVAEKAGSPTVFGHVADTLTDKQVAESVAAACLALLFAAHVWRLTRRPAGDAEL